MIMTIAAVMVSSLEAFIYRHPARPAAFADRSMGEEGHAHGNPATFMKLKRQQGVRQSRP
jgi:hypothetical protein